MLDAYHQRMRKEKELRAAGDFNWREEGLMAVGPASGQLCYLLASSLEAPTILDLGGCFGYSAIWLGAAARARGGRVISMELEGHKTEYAREMAQRAGLADFIYYRVGDALDLIEALTSKLDFVLVDLWKDLYAPCLERFYPRLNPGAIIVADNMVRPGGENAQQYVAALQARPHLQSVLVPVGNGLEITRYMPPQPEADAAPSH